VRIAHVADFALPRLGGIEVHVATCAEHQRARGHDVEIITALAGNGSGLARSRPSVIRSVADAVRAGGFDVVHVHAGVFTPIAFGAAAAASRAGIPTVVTEHSLLSNAHAPMRALDAAIGWTRYPIAWTAVSEPAAAPLRRILGDDAEVAVLPNAIDAADWWTEPVRRVPGDEIVIVGVGRFTGRKRPLPLVRALSRVRSAVGPEVRLSAVLVGDGPKRPSVERHVRRRNLHDWVHFTGRLGHDDIRELHQRADIFVAPCRLESFGIAALEARAAGVPVVGMGDSGVSTFIEHGRDGLLAADDDELVAAITALVTDHELRDRITAHNRSNPPPFGWSDQMDRTEHEYARAAAVQQGRRRRADPLGDVVSSP